MTVKDDFTKADYKALKDVLRTGILRWHKKWQDDLVALIQSPHPEGENEFDRSMEITKRSRDFFKEAMKMEDYYRKSWIIDGIMRLYHEEYIEDEEIDQLKPEIANTIYARYNLIYHFTKDMMP